MIEFGDKQGQIAQARNQNGYVGDQVPIDVKETALCPENRAYISCQCGRAGVIKKGARTNIYQGQKQGSYGDQHK